MRYHWEGFILLCFDGGLTLKTLKLAFICFCIQSKITNILFPSKAGEIVRNYDNPPIKDTFVPPRGGYAVIQFVADNPGWWFFHCHIESHVIVSHFTVKKKKKKKKNGVLTPHVRDKHLYGTLTSGLCWSPWLIPHNLLVNAQNAGSADKRTRPWSTDGGQCSIARSNMAVRITLRASQGLRAVIYMQQGCTCIQRLFDTLANHRTHNTRPRCHLDWRMGIGCAMVVERSDGPMRNQYFPT